MVDIEKSFEKEGIPALRIAEITGALLELGFDVTQDELEAMVDQENDNPYEELLGYLYTLSLEYGYEPDELFSTIGITLEDPETLG